MKQTIEAIHIVAAAMDAQKKKGTPDYNEAVKFKDLLIKLWRKQNAERDRCPHCHKKLT